MLVRDRKPRFDGVSLPQEPPEYVARRTSISAIANHPAPPFKIDYLPQENETWAMVMDELRARWDRSVAEPLLAARDRLGLPSDHIPQLSLVSARLHPITGFRYGSVPGTVSGAEFFAALAQRRFLSTQFIRWSGQPSYTPEPDVIHEVGGHAISLATPELAELHRLAGTAANAAPHLLTEIAAAFWYSIEFGVLTTPEGPKAYGTGLLSSPGELDWFADNAEIRPLDIDEMLATPYDISQYQPVLFAADSLDHALAVVGGYFEKIAHKEH